MDNNKLLEDKKHIEEELENSKKDLEQTRQKGSALNINLAKINKNIEAIETYLNIKENYKKLKKNILFKSLKKANASLALIAFIVATFINSLFFESLLKLIVFSTSLYIVALLSTIIIIFFEDTEEIRNINKNNTKEELEKTLENARNKKIEIIDALIENKNHNEKLENNIQVLLDGKNTIDNKIKSIMNNIKNELSKNLKEEILNTDIICPVKSAYDYTLIDSKKLIRKKL